MEHQFNYIQLNSKLEVSITELAQAYTLSVPRGIFFIVRYIFFLNS